MTARSSQLAAPADAGWTWLRPAAEMAALLTGCWPLGSGRRLEPGPLPGWVAGPLVATRTPAPTASSVASARAFTSRTLRRWGAVDCADDVAVIVSELLTNALRHAVPDSLAGINPIRIGLLYPGRCVLCAVADPTEQVPVLRETSSQAESGRGLHVVASLSASWGYCPVPDAQGKVVWATVPTDSAGRLCAAASA
jgi:anti-sigma regulatory factor (Ser/Thr protein kinase)